MIEFTTVKIKNFVDDAPIEISARQAQGTVCAVVCISQRNGGLSFQHDMRPDQAREMAAALIDAADSLEALK